MEKTAIDDMLHKLKDNKSPVEAAQIDALANLYNDLIETVARCEFRKAFSLGVNITDRLIATPAGKCRVIIDDDDDEFELDEFDFEGRRNRRRRILIYTAFLTSSEVFF